MGRIQESDVRSQAAESKALLFFDLVQELQKRYDHDTARPICFEDAKADLQERLEYIDFAFADGDKALTVLENIGEAIASLFRMADVFEGEVGEQELQRLVDQMKEENAA